MLKATNRLGFWSSVLSAVFSLLWFVTFNLKDVLGPVPDWHDIETYAAAFSPARMLYIYPSLLLAVTFVVMMACIHTRATEEGKIWSLIGRFLPAGDPFRTWRC